MSHNLWPFHINRISTIGIVLYAIWLLTLKLPESPLFALLDRFADNGDVEMLFLAAVALVALNTLRAIPLYVGCFYLGNSFGRYGALLPLVLIPFSSYAFEWFSGGKGHHFGIPSLMGIIFILQLLIWKVPGYLNRAMALCLFLFSFQWLDLAPLLTKYGFGQGEVSLTIKAIADLWGFSSVLNLLGVGGFAMGFIGALMAAALLVNIDLNARQYSKFIEQSKILASLRENALRARMANEIQTLVHDLRRPLTSIQGMVDVLATTAESSEVYDYANCAGAAADQMNGMIEEILREDGRTYIQARELLDYTLGQVSPFAWHRYVQMEALTTEISFWGNRIRLSRALVNLMDNAAHAVSGHPMPQIVIGYRVDDGYIVFFVRDNGPGVSEVSQVGFSGHGSTGLGLSIVQRVAANHHGAFSLQTRPEGGAEALLRLSLGTEQKDAKEKS